MGGLLNEITPALMNWIKRQHMFFVATAPLQPDGHVNLSPKGIEGTFHIVDSNTVWYEDLWGSGNETISHIKENRRITVLFVAFTGAPKIVRLYGKATVFEIGSTEYDELVRPETRKPGSRALIMINVYEVGTSCGFAVPWYEYKGQRKLLIEGAAKMEACDNDDLDGKLDPAQGNWSMKHWWRRENTASLDGLPGLTAALQFSKRFLNTGVPPSSISHTSTAPLLDQPSARAAKSRNGSMYDIEGKAIAGFLWGFLTAVIVLHFVRL